MEQYHHLLKEILRTGVQKESRAILKSTNEHVVTTSIFGYQMRFDLNAGFPLVTTKKVSFHNILHEMLWFLSGSTNIKYLLDQNVHIWDDWADEKGEVGRVYGCQWRGWERHKSKKIDSSAGSISLPDGVEDVDQIQRIIDGVKELKENPTASIGRRMILSAWNVSDLPRMALPPCHTLAQFAMHDGRLCCQLYQRSADAFLGVPYNIASYALLTHMIAYMCDVPVGEFIHTFGDAHIYNNHLEQVQEQLLRAARPLPVLKVAYNAPTIDHFEAHHFELMGYDPHPALKGEVAV